MINFQPGYSLGNLLTLVWKHSPPYLILPDLPPWYRNLPQAGWENVHNAKALKKVSGKTKKEITFL